MEIADVFVINKADRKGVEETERDLMQMLDLSDLPHDAWRPPIVPTVARRARASPRCGTPCSPTVQYAETVRPARGSGARFRLREELREIVALRLGRRAREICSGERWDELTDAVVEPVHRPVDGRRRDARRRRRLTGSGVCR